MLTRLGKPAEALIPLGAAQETSERLAHEHPGVVEYQDDVARGFQYLAGALGKLGHVADARKAYTQAVGVREKMLQTHPTDSQNVARLFLLFNEQGDFERGVHQPASAIAAYKSAIKLCEGRSHTTADQLYDLAAVHAKLSSTGSDANSGLKSDDVRAEADAAVALLNKSLDAGFRNVDQIRKDPDLDKLRARDDFKKLLERLESGSTVPADKSNTLGPRSKS